MIERLWVQIPALYTGWTFFALIFCKNCIVCLKRPKINEKEAGVGSFLKKPILIRVYKVFASNWDHYFAITFAKSINCESKAGMLVSRYIGR